MIIKVEAKERFLAEHGWLSSYHLFSFAEYYDPYNMHFGTLRVFNDDYIDGKNGFPPHRHENMEIITIVLEGELSHEDSMGNRSTIQEGEVQYMSAGKGVVHSEMNHGDKRTHLYQIWLLPKKNSLTPTYDQKNFSENSKNELVPVVSDASAGDAIIIQADVTIYKGDFEKGKSCTHKVQEGRGIFIYITEGVLEINDIMLTTGDQARIENETSVILKSTQATKFVLIDVEL
jgi:redox-sensitive bicupin YhaK (pirin superfamily)